MQRRPLRSAAAAHLVLRVGDGRAVVLGHLRQRADGGQGRRRPAPPGHRLRRPRQHGGAAGRGRSRRTRCGCPGGAAGAGWCGCGCAGSRLLIRAVGSPFRRSPCCCSSGRRCTHPVSPRRLEQICTSSCSSAAELISTASCVALSTMLGCAYFATVLRYQQLLLVCSLGGSFVVLHND